MDTHDISDGLGGLFEGEFTEAEKAAAAFCIMRHQDEKSSAALRTAIGRALLAAFFIVLGVILLTNIGDVIDMEMHPEGRIFSFRSLHGIPGIVEDIIGVILAPMLIWWAVMGFVGIEREKRRYSEFRVRRYRIAHIRESKGEFTVRFVLDDREIELVSKDRCLCDAEKGDIFMIADFPAADKERYLLIGR